MKQTIAGDKTTKEKSKKAGTLLCAKKNPKKKKKKAPYNVAYNDGGYPLYATSTVDGEHCYTVIGEQWGRYALSKVRRCLRHNLCSQPYGSKSLVRSTGSAV
jgi:hypothetical protein